MTAWQKSRHTPFHLPRDGYECHQDWHYFPTACQNEIKAPYGQWIIAEDPDPKSCCKKCLAIQKKEEALP